MILADEKKIFFIFLFAFLFMVFKIPDFGVWGKRDSGGEAVKNHSKAFTLDPFEKNLSNHIYTMTHCVRTFHEWRYYILENKRHFLVLPSPKPVIKFIILGI